MRWLTVTHTQRWHAHYHSSGTGPVYQGRFKSFPVESDEHFLTVSRYVERNALTANLVERTQDWPWSSLWRRRQRDKDAARILTAWPVAIPTDWIRRVNRPMTKKEQESMQRCIKRGQPFGSDDWIRQTAEQLRLESTLRPPRRPRKSRGDNENDSRPFDLATDFSRHPDRIVQPSQYHREFKTS